MKRDQKILIYHLILLFLWFSFSKTIIPSFLIPTITHYTYTSSLLTCKSLLTSIFVSSFQSELRKKQTHTHSDHVILFLTPISNCSPTQIKASLMWSLTVSSPASSHFLLDESACIHPHKYTIYNYHSNTHWQAFALYLWYLMSLAYSESSMHLS